MRISRRNKILIAALAAVILFGLIALICFNQKGPKVPSISAGTPITEKNLPEVSDVMRAAELSNVDLFETWVYEYYESSNGERKSAAYSDTDSLMAAMLLADDQISCSGAKPYSGAYLAEDVYRIERENAYLFIRDNLEVFTTIFGEMPVPGSGLEDALPRNWKKHGVDFINEKSFLVSMVVRPEGAEEACVGHAGILIDCKSLSDNAQARYLFVEKTGIGESFAATWLSSTEELMELLAGRDVTAGAKVGEAPLVYVNDRLLGELPQTDQ